MTPWCSVIVPVYNVEKYLERCIDSLVHQTYADLEIILVDDGSADGSGIICDQYAEEYEYISVIHKPNGGLASARNAGLEKAKGQYVSFIDSDDWVRTNTYEILHEACKAALPDIVNFGCLTKQGHVQLSEEYGEFPAGFYDQGKIQRKILPDSIAHEKAFDQVNLPVQLSACMCIYKCAFLRNHGLNFESERLILNEDWLFNIQCMCRAESMMILHEALYHYDVRENSLSMSYKPNTYEHRKALCRRYKEELKKTGNWNEVTRQRLRNFWMESIYCCYIIEMWAPSWNKDQRKRLTALCNDENFVAYAQQMDSQNCACKGLLFILISKFKLHWLFKLVYSIKKLK